MIEMGVNYTLFGGGINIEALIISCFDKFSKIIRLDTFFKLKKENSKKGLNV